VTRRGDELFERVRGGGNGEARNRLLDEFFRGYPLDRLRILLRSEDDDVAGAGLFIAGELGKLAAPVMGDVEPLLGHGESDLRFDAVRAVLYGASSEHGETIAKAVGLIRDPHEGVRLSVLSVLDGLSNEALAASLPHLEDGELASLTGWLCGSEDTEAYKQEVVDRLESADPLARMFAGAAAGRLAEADRAPLELAAQSTQPEVRKSAQSLLDALAHREKQWERRRRVERRRSRPDADP
jgi:hypothetical protein